MQNARCKMQKLANILHFYEWYESRPRAGRAMGRQIGASSTRTSSGGPCREGGMGERWRPDRPSKKMTERTKSGESCFTSGPTSAVAADAAFGGGARVKC